jgi:hypothetical protein
MWYYTYQGHQLGPVDINGFKNLMRSNVVNGASMIWREGWEEWKRLNETDLIWLYEELKGQPLEREKIQVPEQDEESSDENEEKIWYYQQEGYTHGPVCASAMQRLLREGEIEEVSLVRRINEAAWHHLDETDLIWLLQEDLLDEKEDEDFEVDDSAELSEPQDVIEEGEQLWYYISDDKIYGPVTTREVVVMRAKGELNGHTQVSSSQNGPWKMLGETGLADSHPGVIDTEEE